MKATPLVMIAVGLSVCYIANVWNIGAEGQFIIGAVAGSWLAVRTPGDRRGRLGPAVHAAARRARRRALRDDPGDLPGALRRERDPDQPDAGLCRRAAARLAGARPLARSAGPQFPDHGGVRSGRHRAGADRRQPPARRRDPRPDRRRCWRACCSAARSRASRSAWSARRPRRRRFAGFDAQTPGVVLLRRLGRARRPCRHHRGGRPDRPAAAGHLAGLRLHRDHRRLPRPPQSARHPRRRPGSGAHLSSAARAAQIALEVPLDLTKVFQGILLFFVLACDTLILYRIRLRRRAGEGRAGMEHA